MKYNWLKDYEDERGTLELSHELILADVIMKLIETLKKIEVIE
jgi:hypothetical protein